MATLRQYLPWHRSIHHINLTYIILLLVTLYVHAGPGNNTGRTSLPTSAMDTGKTSNSLRAPQAPAQPDDTTSDISAALSMERDPDDMPGTWQMRTQYPDVRDMTFKASTAAATAGSGRSSSSSSESDVTLYRNRSRALLDEFSDKQQDVTLPTANFDRRGACWVGLVQRHVPSYQ